MRSFERYRFRDGVTTLSEAEFNPRFSDVDLRLHTLEEMARQFSDIMSDLTAHGLERLDGALQPVFDELTTRMQRASDLLADVAQLLEEQGALPAAVAQLEAWQAALDPPKESFIRPDRLRTGAAALTYDQAGRVSAVEIALPGAILYELAYTYDQGGRLTQVAATLGGQALWMRTYTYDQNNNVISWAEA